MMTAPEKKPFTPQSRQVAKELIKSIHGGEYLPGQKLDSIRTLAERYGVGRQVVLSAVTLLAKQNYVYTLRGSGTYINPQLKPGLYYRLGWFIHQADPIITGKSLYYARLYAKTRKFKVIMGSNYEENFTLEDWLRQKDDLDGVVVGGFVEEQILKYPRAHRIPYVVFGNYDIDPAHPQVNYDVVELYYRNVEPLLREHKWKKVAAVVGAATRRSDREAAEGIRRAIVKTGHELYPELIIHAEADGYEETAQLLKNHSPDVIIFCAGYWQGWQKFLELNKDFKRPEIVVAMIPDMPELVPSHIYDYCYDEDKSSEYEREKVRNVIDELINRIKTPGGSAHEES